MAAQPEVEELQLQLESKFCSIDLNGLVELAAHLNVEFKKLAKLALSKKIREEVENSLIETEDKKVHLVGLLAFVNGNPPPLEGDATANKEQVKVKHGSLNQSGTLKEKTETKELKVNLGVSKVRDNPCLWFPLFLLQQEPGRYILATLPGIVNGGIYSTLNIRKRCLHVLKEYESLECAAIALSWPRHLFGCLIHSCDN